jgi:hypothetical protein
MDPLGRRAALDVGNVAVEEVGDLGTRLPSTGAGGNSYPPTRGFTAEVSVTF